ncbi:MAG TPA: type II secretion system protein [Chthonomonadales bacterium]|nr:type II secretion system protein [Chthonomonadales bacterium]
MLRRRVRAFTLVELLVVIAIVTVVLAILLPALTTVRAKARATACLCNLRQVAAAVNLYTQDYDELYPRSDVCVAPAPNPFGAPATGCNGPYGQRVNHYKWQAWLLPYTRSTGIFICPDRDIDDQNWRMDGEYYNAYCLNLSITGSTDTWPEPAWRGAYRNAFTGGGVAGIRNPSATMLLMESFFPGVWSYVTPPAAVQVAYPMAVREVWECALKVYGAPNQLAAPHLAGMNLAYCDGHASFVTVDQFLAQCPTRAEYGDPPVPRPNRPDCRAGFPGWMIWSAPAPPTWSQPWPMWGLE